MTNDDQVAIMKLKMQLYGYYVREYKRLEHRYFDIEMELSHNDMPHKSAGNLGVHSTDPYHPAEEQLLLEYASIEHEIVAIEDELVKFGVTGFLSLLNPEQRKIIECTYIAGMSQRDVGQRLGMSQSTVQRCVNDIFHKLTS